MIVLNTTRLGEDSLIIHGYNEDRGRISAVLNRTLCRRWASITPLSILEIQTYGKGEMEKVRDFSHSYPLSSIRRDISKTAMAFFTAELLYRTLPQRESDQLLYNFTVTSILLLEESRRNIANFHLWFSILYLKYMGIAPSSDSESTYNPFSDKEKEFIKICYGAKFEEAMDYVFSSLERNALVESILKYAGYHLGIESRKNSAEVFRSVFQNLKK